MGKKETRLLYGIDGQEFLDDSIEEVIERIKNELNNIKWPIEVFEHKPIEIYLFGSGLIERILEELDDEYGNPYTTSYTKPTDAMIEAADNLVDVIKRDYNVWACEPTGKVYLVHEDGKITGEQK